MQLKEIPVNYFGIELVRNGEFENLGNFSNTKDRLLIFLEDINYLPTTLEHPTVSCIITRKKIAEKIPENVGLAVADNPKIAFLKLHNYLSKNTDFYCTPFDTEISDSAVVHQNAYVATKNVRIGPGCIIESGVSILEGTTTGQGVTVRAGSTIGAIGNENLRDHDNSFFRVEQAGGVFLSDGVIISSNSCIQRSVFKNSTFLGEETIVDSLVLIGHQVFIGKRCFITGGVVIAGSTVIGDDVYIGPNATISNNLHIGNNVFITIGSVVTKNIDSEKAWIGGKTISREIFELVRSLKK